jgi:iron-sulfur cluster assembly accessory protein
MKFTEEACEKLKAIAAVMNIAEPIVVRLRVTEIGCSGISYDMNFVDDEEKLICSELSSNVKHFADFSVVYDESASSDIEELTIDYVYTEFGEGFKFVRQGNAIEKCNGCATKCQ